jgi:hypothetical protein
VITAKLIASLLTAVAGYTGYAIPGVPPEIVTLAHADLAEVVCGRPCGVLAFTTPEGRILLDDSLAVGRDPRATSILVHELTHFLQLHAAAARGDAGKPSGAALSVPMDCHEWNEREHEAYEVQFRWLRDTVPTMRTLSSEIARLGAKPVFPAC